MLFSQSNCKIQSLAISAKYLLHHHDFWHAHRPLRKEGSVSRPQADESKYVLLLLYSVDASLACDEIF